MKKRTPRRMVYKLWKELFKEKLRSLHQKVPLNDRFYKRLFRKNFRF